MEHSNDDSVKALVKTIGDGEGTQDLIQISVNSVPDPEPYDELVRAKVRRVRHSVRIQTASVEMHGNGYTVTLPDIGQYNFLGNDQNMFLFDDLAAVLVFLGQVMGKTHFAYSEERITDKESGEYMYERLDPTTGEVISESKESEL